MHTDIFITTHFYQRSGATTHLLALVSSPDHFTCQYLVHFLKYFSSTVPWVKISSQWTLQFNKIHIPYPHIQNSLLGSFIFKIFPLSVSQFKFYPLGRQFP